MTSYTKSPQRTTHFFRHGTFQPSIIRNAPTMSRIPPVFRLCLNFLTPLSPRPTHLAMVQFMTHLRLAHFNDNLFINKVLCWFERRRGYSGEANDNLFDCARKTGIGIPATERPISRPTMELYYGNRIIAVKDSKY